MIKASSLAYILFTLINERSHNKSTNCWNEITVCSTYKHLETLGLEMSTESRTLSFKIKSWSN